LTNITPPTSMERRKWLHFLNATEAVQIIPQYYDFRLSYQHC